MSWFYKVSEKELLKVRNRIFLEKGVPALESNGFLQSPLSTAWYGKNNLGDYTYEICRWSKEKYLEMIVTHISTGDNWIKVFLNIFELIPKLKSIEEISGVDGLNYHLPPNSKTKMRLRIDDIKGMPFLDYHFMFGGHKLGSYNTKSGYDQRVKELGNLIEQDLINIDSFVKKWHEMHEPNVVDWEGNRIE